MANHLGRWKAAYKYASKIIQHDLKLAHMARLEKVTGEMECEARDKSDFLTYRNDDNQQADFCALRHSDLSLECPKRKTPELPGESAQKRIADDR